jgi:hypothetical protein
MSKDADRTFEERNHMCREDDASKKALEWLSSRNCFHRVIGFDSIDNRVPKENWFHISSFMRNMPDMIIIRGKKASLLEVKGCEEAVKIKLSDIAEYLKWDAFEPLYFFIYCSKSDKFYVPSMYQLLEIASEESSKLGKYPDNTKLYIEIPEKKLKKYEKRMKIENGNTSTTT